MHIQVTATKSCDLNTAEFKLIKSVCCSDWLFQLHVEVCFLFLILYLLIHICYSGTQTHGKTEMGQETNNQLFVMWFIFTEIIWNTIILVRQCCWTDSPESDAKFECVSVTMYITTHYLLFWLDFFFFPTFMICTHTVFNSLLPPIHTALRSRPFPQSKILT